MRACVVKTDLQDPHSSPTTRTSLPACVTEDVWCVVSASQAAQADTV